LEVVDTTQNGEAAHPKTELPRIVVDEAHHGDSEPPAALDLLDQSDTCLTGADYQREGLDATHAGATPSLAKSPNRESGACREHRTENKIQEKYRARKIVKPAHKNEAGKEKRRS
jgi:hypothetical protein